MALNILNVNIDKYEQHQCNQFAGTIPIQCGSVGRISPFTSLHTTGSLCVPVDERTDKRDQFPNICGRQVNCQSCDPSHRIKGSICLIIDRQSKMIHSVSCNFYKMMDGIATWASSSSVKSFLMLKVFLISSGVLPLIMLATVLQVTSNRPLMSK